MTDNTETSFIIRCQILSDLWVNYKSDETFSDFFQYSDLGLPLAYAISNEIILNNLDNEKLIGFINETWTLLLEGLGIQEDIGFDNLDELFGIVGE
jgi:hypothetical protein